jgi:hypothetical protein
VQTSFDSSKSLYQYFKDKILLPHLYQKTGHPEFISGSYELAHSVSLFDC